MQVVAICLVRDDDRFLDQVIRNTLSIADRLIVADHQSVDGTRAIAEHWERSDGRVSYHRIADPSESHDLIRVYAGSDTWVFGVDGDELYEPDRLLRLRKELELGNYVHVWQLMGKVLHCVSFDEKLQVASGYMARPSRPMTKLYNFSLIEDWEGPCSERLHHGRVVFKKGCDEGLKDVTQSETDWDEALFRCLHMVFVRRSSAQRSKQVARPNIAEKNAFGLLGKLYYRIASTIGREPESRTKQEAYMRGPLCQVSTKRFFET